MVTEIGDLLGTYAANIRMAAARKQVEARDLASQSGYSYEHIRNIWLGDQPKRKNKLLTVSRECNNILCELLELPADAMYALGEREKFAQKNGYQPLQLVDPQGQELSEIWQSLADDHKNVLLRMAHGFAAELQVA